MTEFQTVYSVFLDKVTDDMYMELDKDQTYKMLQPLLISALHYFEFPRQNIFNYDIELNRFNITLTQEEINIIAVYMTCEWVRQQIVTVENTRQKYSGSDFKMTSQANHLGKLIALREAMLKDGKHLQRLYKRRTIDENGVIKSTFGSLMG